MTRVLWRQRSGMISELVLHIREVHACTCRVENALFGHESLGKHLLLHTEMRWSNYRLQKR